MFKGFTTNKLPEYEIITPQTKKSFTIKSLTVSSEEHLKGSFIVSVKMIEHLNKCIFDAIATFPEDIVTFDDFNKKLSTLDREALLYALYHISYDEVKHYEITCEKCEKVYPINVNIADIFSICVYPGEDDILKKRVKVDLPIYTNVKVYLKQPTIDDEVKTLKAFAPALGKEAGLASDILIIDRIEEINGKEVIAKYTSQEDLFDAYRTLPPKDRSKINEEYKKQFGEYSIDLKLKSVCQFCGHEEEVRVDLITQFFRMVHSG